MSKFKVDDKVRVIKNIKSRFGNHCLKTDDEFTITRIQEGDCGKEDGYQGGEHGQILVAEELELVTKFKVGDVVKVVCNSKYLGAHCFTTGEEVVITEVGSLHSTSNQQKYRAERRTVGTPWNNHIVESEIEEVSPKATLPAGCYRATCIDNDCYDKKITQCKEDIL